MSSPERHIEFATRASSLLSSQPSTGPSLVPATISFTDTEDGRTPLISSHSHTERGTIRSVSSKKTKTCDVTLTTHWRPSPATLASIRQYGWYKITAEPSQGEEDGMADFISLVNSHDNCFDGASSSFTGIASEQKFPGYPVSNTALMTATVPAKFTSPDSDVSFDGELKVRLIMVATQPDLMSSDPRGVVVSMPPIGEEEDE